MVLYELYNVCQMEYSYKEKLIHIFSLNIIYCWTDRRMSEFHLENLVKSFINVISFFYRIYSHILFFRYHKFTSIRCPGSKKYNYLLILSHQSKTWFCSHFSQNIREIFVYSSLSPTFIILLKATYVFKKSLIKLYNTFDIYN